MLVFLLCMGVLLGFFLIDGLFLEIFIWVIFERLVYVDNCSDGYFRIRIYVFVIII